MKHSAWQRVYNGYKSHTVTAKDCDGVGKNTEQDQS